MIAAGAFECRLDGILFRQADREGDPLGGDAGIVEGFIEQGGQIAQIGGSGKPPGALVEHADAHAALAGGGGALQVAVPHHQVIGFLEGIPAGVHVGGALGFDAFDLLLDIFYHSGFSLLIILTVKEYPVELILPDKLKAVGHV